jgi:hypothetical protein
LGAIRFFLAVDQQTSNPTTATTQTAATGKVVKDTATVKLIVSEATARCIFTQK